MGSQLDIDSTQLKVINSSQSGLTCTFRASCYNTRLSWAHNPVTEWSKLLYRTPVIDSGVARGGGRRGGGRIGRHFYRDGNFELKNIDS